MSTLSTLSRDQKIAALALPVLLFGILGASYAYADFSDLTDEQRSAIEEAHSLREAGNYEAAKKVLEGADLPLHPPHRGFGKGSTIRTAIENNDYDAFARAAQNSPFADMVSEDLFATLREAQALRESGDFAGARQLLEDAGVPQPPHGPHGPWHHDG